MTRPSKKKIEDISAGQAEEVWRKAKKAKAAPPPESNRMSLFTLRIDNETLDELVLLAQKEVVGPSVIARQLIRESIERRRIAPAVAEALETQLRKTLDDFYRYLFGQKAASSTFLSATSFEPSGTEGFLLKEEVGTYSPEPATPFKRKEAV